jgi:hypothetical protein
LISLNRVKIVAHAKTNRFGEKLVLNSEKLSFSLEEVYFA